MRAAEAETMWSEKVNSLHLRGTPTRAGGQTPGGGGAMEGGLPARHGGGEVGGGLPARGGVSAYFGVM